MCGICGIVNFEKSREVKRRAVERMTAVMAHRGPNQQGIHVRGHVGLGHRRLSIIDLTSGNQPMCNEDGTVWIAFNGEIYNYRELQDDLIGKGHVFKTRSDTETIIHAYEEFGECFLQKLRGMFSFALWDERNQILFAARDRIGKKPFYYSATNDHFIFSSEIKSILQYPGQTAEIEHRALDFYLRLRYVPGPFTLFKGIRKLQPGHYLVLKNGKALIHEYWDVSNIPTTAPRKSQGYIEEFLALLEESVRIRLMSEVPLGVFLSGGIDSSLVVAVMSKMSPSPVKTFSVGYEQDNGVNEFNFARLTAERYHTEHHELRVKSRNFFDVLPKLAWHLDEPIADAATIPLYFLSESAKEWITVVLSGEGADEILAGYYIYKKMLLLEKFRKIPARIRERIVLALLSSVARSERWKKYLGLASLPLEQRYFGVSSSFSKEAKTLLFPRSADFEGELENLFEGYYQRVKERRDLDKMLYVDLKVWLPDDLLMKADKMTMAASMELRVPFLDHKLVEFAFSLPQNLKLQGNTTKCLLRTVGSALLPPQIISRQKKGFPVPLSAWLKGDLYHAAQDLLLGSNSACRRYFDPSRIKIIIEKHGSNQADVSEQLWNLLVFEYWHQIFLTSNRRQDD